MLPWPGIVPAGAAASQTLLLPPPESLLEICLDRTEIKQIPRKSVLRDGSAKEEDEQKRGLVWELLGA